MIDTLKKLIEYGETTFIKYYEVVTTCDNCDDEWTYYEGYDLDEAYRVYRREDTINSSGWHTEIRVFNLKKPREEMSDDEWCGFYCCPGYDVI